MEKPRPNRQVGPVPMGGLDERTRWLIQQSRTHHVEPLPLLGRLPKPIKRILPVLAVALTGCAGVQTAGKLPEPPPQIAIPPPTAQTGIPKSTETPPVPMIRVGEIQVPVLDFESPSSKTAVDQYAKAFDLDAGAVVEDISYKEVKGSNGSSFAVALTKDGTPLFIATQDQKSGEWKWKNLYSKDLVQAFKNPKTGKDFIIGYQTPIELVSNPNFNKSVELNFNHAMVDGPLHWKKTARLTTNDVNPLDVNIMFDFSELRRLINNAQDVGITSMGFDHVLWGLKSSTFQEISDDVLNLGTKLKQKGYSSDQIKEVYSKLLKSGVTQTVQEIKKTSPQLKNRVISLFNEPRPMEKLVIDGRPQVWTDNLGEDAIDMAFETAASLVGPEDVLLINNTLNMAMTERSNSDFDRLVRIRQKLEAKGIKTRLGYGIQGNDGTNPEEMQRNIQRFTAAGFEVYVTEARNKDSIGDLLNAAIKGGANGFVMFYNTTEAPPSLVPFDRAINQYTPNKVTFNINKVFLSNLA